MDDTDRIILRLLNDDGRMSFTEIGEYLSMSRVAVKKRVRKLEESGVICGYKAVINQNELAKMYMDITTVNESYNHLLDYLKCISYVTELCVMFSQNRIHATVEAPDVSELKHFKDTVSDKFTDIIGNIETHLVKNTVKDTFGGATMIDLNEHVVKEMNKYLDGITIENLIAKRSELFHYKVTFNRIELVSDIDVLNLSQRSYNCLKRAGVYTIGDIIKNYNTKPGATSRSQLRKIRNLGAKSADEIIMNLFYYHFMTIPLNERAAYMDQLLKENPI